MNTVRIGMEARSTTRSWSTAAVKSRATGSRSPLVPLVWRPARRSGHAPMVESCGRRGSQTWRHGARAISCQPPGRPRAMMSGPRAPGPALPLDEGLASQVVAADEPDACCWAAAIRCPSRPPTSAMRTFDSARAGRGPSGPGGRGGSGTEQQARLVVDHPAPRLVVGDGVAAAGRHRQQVVVKTVGHAGIGAGKRLANSAKNSSSLMGRPMATQSSSDIRSRP